MNKLVISAHELNRYYETRSGRLHVLKNTTLSINSGETVALVGPSGSGKSTLLSLLAGLDTADSGEVTLCGQVLSRLSEDEKALLRRQHVGFIFQSFQLLGTLTALENVMVPMELLKKSGKAVSDRAMSLLSELGLYGRVHHYPSQLSGGEQQRVAIARAFINEPSVLFADEPTGNLDTETGLHIEDCLFRLNTQFQTTLVLVTHNNDLAQKAQRIIRMKAGELVGV